MGLNTAKMRHHFRGSHGKGECKAHKDMLEELVERLSLKSYDLLASNVRYQVGSIEGEIDVLAIRDDIYHFYEVKSGKCKYSKAQEQFDRFKATHPHTFVKGIYVGKNRIRRLK
jgi:Holliday junction resolvase-like predicted endonuclease